MLCIDFDSLSRFLDHRVDHAAQRLLLRIALQPTEAEVVELPVGAAAVADDGQHVPQLVFAVELAGVVRQILDELNPVSRPAWNGDDVDSA